MHSLGLYIMLGESVIQIWAFYKSYTYNFNFQEVLSNFHIHVI